MKYISSSAAYALNCDAESWYNVIPRALHVEYTYSVSHSEVSKLDTVYGLFVHSMFKQLATKHLILSKQWQYSQRSV